MIKSSDTIDLNQNDTKERASSNENFENRKIKSDYLMNPIEFEQRSSSATSTPGSENADDKNFKLNWTDGSIENRTKVNLGEYSTVSNSTAIEEQGFEIPNADIKGTNNGIEKYSHMINGSIHKKDENNEKIEKDDNRTTQYTTSATTIHLTQETNEEEGSGTGINDHSTKRSSTTFFAENPDIGE